MYPSPVNTLFDVKLRCINQLFFLNILPLVKKKKNNGRLSSLSMKYGARDREAAS